MRKKFQGDRSGITHKFSLGHGDEELRCYFTVNCMEDGKPGEIFIHLGKAGSLIHGFADAFATLFSLALQYGIPLSKLIEKTKAHRFEPNGFTGSPHEELKVVSSVLDYIARWLEMKFITNKKGAPKNDAPTTATSPPPELLL